MSFSIRGRVPPGPRLVLLVDSHRNFDDQLVGREDSLGDDHNRIKVQVKSVGLDLVHACSGP